MTEDILEEYEQELEEQKANLAMHEQYEDLVGFDFQIHQLKVEAKKKIYDLLDWIEFIVKCKTK